MAKNKPVGPRGPELVNFSRAEREPDPFAQMVLEMTFENMRAGGPGGQGVNTSDSAVRARWNVDESGAFTAEEKAKIKERLAGKINAEGELYTRESKERKQRQNHDRAVERLQNWVREALTERAERIEEAPKEVAAKIERRRLDAKRAEKLKKQARSGRFAE